MNLEIINASGIIPEVTKRLELEALEIKNFESGKLREGLGNQFVNLVFSEKLTEEQLEKLRLVLKYVICALIENHTTI